MTSPKFQKVRSFDVRMWNLRSYSSVETCLENYANILCEHEFENA